MEYISDISEKLKKVFEGADVQCLNCHKGKCVPFGNDFKTVHSAHCDKCGDCINVDSANVIVD